MITEYCGMTEDRIDEEKIRYAGQILKNGGIVAFPTETVYGLGGDALNPASSQKIYAAKGRPSDNPLIVHVCCLEDIPKITKDLPPEWEKLAKAFWPGPLTMIFKKNDRVPYETTGGLDTVAIRFPSNKIAMALIREGGRFIAAPSANRSGRPSTTTAEHCREDLDGRVDMIIDGGPVGIGLESTIIDLTGDKPTILRPGYITKEMLEAVLDEVDIDRTIISADSGLAPKAPGMKYRHYAPKGELIIVEGERDAVINSINEEASAARAEGKKTAVICTDETKDAYIADVIVSVGSENDPDGIARELFSILRSMDECGAEAIYSESFDNTGVGMAIMNRLMKAAGQKVMHAEHK